MKYLKTYENNKEDKFWLIPIEEPYYSIALEYIIGMVGDELEEWIEKRETIERDRDVKKGYVIIFNEYSNNNLGLEKYSWAGDKDYEYYIEKDDKLYMGKITKTFIKKNYSNEIKNFYIKNDMKKYNL